ncbi:hypothetical protein JCM3765_000401 [Sporobolomyces pararoseus]
MYFPSPLPTTRLSLSTSFTPLGPSSASRPSTPYRTPGRPPKGKFKGDLLGGVQEEEGEQVLEIVKCSQPDLQGKTLWASLGREEVNVWCTRPKVVLAKLKRSPLSLRSFGSNQWVQFHSPTRLLVTTTTGHTLLYSIEPLPPSKSNVYVLPARDKGNVQQVWPRGSGEGEELKGIVLKGEAERSIQVGDGIGCVCLTRTDYLVSVLDPPCLRIIPFPSSSTSSTATTTTTTSPTPPPPPPPLPLSSSRLSRFPSTISSNSQQPVPQSLGRRGSGWEFTTTSTSTSTTLTAGSGERDSEVIVLDDWNWLIGKERKDVTISQLVALPQPQEVETGDTPTRRVSTRFVMLTSDGRAYLVNWGLKIKTTRDTTPLTTTMKTTSNLSSDNILFDLDQDGQREPTEGGDQDDDDDWEWIGVCFHPRQSERELEEEEEGSLIEDQEKELDKGKGASTSCFNEKMDLIAVGCEDGTISVYSLPTSLTPHLDSEYSSSSTLLSRPIYSHTHSLLASLSTTTRHLSPSRVTSLSYTSDGQALASGYEKGWSIWSVFGRLSSWSSETALKQEGSGYGVEGEKGNGFEDHFLSGVRKLFWNQGDTELFVLCPPPIHPKKKPHDEQLFVIPFAKSAVTSLHTPDNTKNGFLQLDDRVMVYRGSDQPDLSVINPESDVWQHLKIPSSYLSLQHPIKYSCISNDARLISVAGRRGFCHYNALSGRWKLFENSQEEEVLKVVGGMSWWGNVLIVGTLETSGYQLRLFSRDQPLSISCCLFNYRLDSEPLVLSIFDSSLLVYTADNTFYHFLIKPVGTNGMVKLRLCGSIGFEGVVKDPRKVRGVSWLIPKSQQRFGDAADDLNVATIIFLISGKLVLLRPRRAQSQEVKYDLQLLSSSIEFFWTHLSGIGTLENSLWGYDGTSQKIQIWLDALTIEKVRVDRKRDVYEKVKESVGVELDFYPLAILMEKGIVVGVDQEINLRKNLDFAVFRIITTTHLFLHHILRFHLTRNQMKEAVLFASHYQHLVYFSHSLEILLHGVLEDEADAAASKEQGQEQEEVEEEGVLPRVVEFLDHFEECLQVVVNCARKTEQARWEFLFKVVGKPRDLFEKCISSGFLKVASSYLLVLHNLEPIEQSSKDTVRLLTTAMQVGDWNLCRELLRFLYSLDRTGLILRAALSESSALPNLFPTSLNPDPRRIFSAPVTGSSSSSSSSQVSTTTGLGGGEYSKPVESARGVRTPSMPPRETGREGGRGDTGFGSLMGRMM